MALTSPGVEVTIIDESQTASGGSGTVPLIVFASAQDKIIPGSTTVASGTTKEQANELYLLTSQQEVLSTFGSPIFEENENNQVVQGGELNEYGLWTGFNYLGAMNRAYMVRADIDLNELQVKGEEPLRPVDNGVYWVDPDNSVYHASRANGSPSKPSAWDNVEVLSYILTDAELDALPLAENVIVAQFHADTLVYKEKVNGEFFIIGSDAWKANFNTVTSSTLAASHDFAITIDGNVSNITASTDTELETSLNTLVTSGDEEFVVSVGTGVTILVNTGHTVKIVQTDTGVNVGLDGTVSGVDVSFNTNLNIPAGTGEKSIWINPVSANVGNDINVRQYSSSKGDWVSTATTLADSDVVAETRLAPVAVGDVYYFHTAEATLLPMRFDLVTETSTTLTVSTVTSGALTLDFAGNITDGVVDVVANETVGSITNKIRRVFSRSNNVDFVVTKVGQVITIKNIKGLALSADAGTTGVVVDGSLASNWEPMTAEVLNDEPLGIAPVNETIWYDDRLFADVLINDGDKWCGLQSPEGIVALTSKFGSAGTTAQPIYSVLVPDNRPHDASALEVGDIWIETADLADLNYAIFDGSNWVELDKTNQSDASGLLFGSIRTIDLAGTKTEIESRIATAALTFVDSDNDDRVPACEAYPEGMIAFNIRAVGDIVKIYDDVNAEWDLHSGLHFNGDLRTNWLAQRQPVVEALASTIASNTTLRAETVDYSLILTPGYFECVDEMVNLNIDRKETAYVVTDVPARLSPQAGEVVSWAQNVNNTSSNGSDGRVTMYPYAAQYYGWGVGTNVDGKEVVIPPSSVALRTYAYNDSVSYVWFPPAGFTRGIVSNATSTGFINAEGEFEPAILDQGQRNAMYENNINPITFRPGRGLVVYGDKSLSPTSSALDRVNVGRLMVYIKKEIARMTDQYLFEINNSRTRGSLQGVISSFLSQIAEKEGLYDFSVVCSDSNNPPASIDQNILNVDVYVQPTKSINFIYVSLRIESTGA